MKCPFCGNEDQKVLDSRPAREGEAIRRRRECVGCNRRFTTFEEPERPRLFVEKRDGSREEFDRDKCLNSMLIACRKRGISVDILRASVERIERDLFQECEDEAPTTKIGDKVLAELFEIDSVAYVRFASVYKDFDTVTDFQEIIESLRGVKRRASSVERQA
ncbi:MAG TPA: transcriptional regulator NrdR [Fimbriimonadaceae bacterium]|nr:transcriptional regulator NrdR [Fimbriimonadaceae bacterium]